MNAETSGSRLPAVWGIVGILTLFIEAVYSLGTRGLATLRAGLDPQQATALVVLTAFFVYTEGYRALQRRWIPRVLVRLRLLGSRGRLVHRLLAPLYGMSLIGAPPGTMARAWLGVAGIVVAVLIVRSLPEPWRGIVDFAVAAALAWAVGAFVAQAVGARRAGGLPRDTVP